MLKKHMQPFILPTVQKLICTEPKRAARCLLRRQLRCSRAEWAHGGGLSSLTRPQVGSPAPLDDWEERARKGDFLFRTRPKRLAVQDFRGRRMRTRQPWAQMAGVALPRPRQCPLSPTSDCCSGSFMLSKILKTIRNRSCHQCLSKVWP